MACVTLLSDFGTADYFAGAMKGALLTVCPSARVFDLTHEIPPHDIAAGAFTLWAAHSAWPVGTIHLAVVDPGVGSARRAIIVKTGGHFLVGPDNGLFGLFYEHDAHAQVWHATTTEYMRQPVNASFHGRDVFAPLAGALAGGVAPAQCGPEITDYVRPSPQFPRKQPDGAITAHIIHIDRFGNCVTSLTDAELSPAQAALGFRLEINRQVVTRYAPYFADGAATDEPFLARGSAGFWEISYYCAAAAARLGVVRGTQLVLALPGTGQYPER